MLESGILGCVQERKVGEYPWDQKGKGDHSRFPATELEMSLGELDLMRRRRSAFLDFCFLFLYLFPLEGVAFSFSGVACLN